MLGCSFAPTVLIVLRQSDGLFPVTLKMVSRQSDPGIKEIWRTAQAVTVA